MVDRRMYFNFQARAFTITTTPESSPKHRPAPVPRARESPARRSRRHRLHLGGSGGAAAAARAQRPPLFALADTQPLRSPARWSSVPRSCFTSYGPMDPLGQPFTEDVSQPNQQGAVIARLLQRNASLNASLSAKEQTISEQRQTIHDLVQQLNEQGSSIAKLKTDATTVQLEHNKEKAHLQECIYNLRNRVAELTGACSPVVLRTVLEDLLRIVCENDYGPELAAKMTKTDRAHYVFGENPPMESAASKVQEYLGHKFAKIEWEDFQGPYAEFNALQSRREFLKWLYSDLSAGCHTTPFETSWEKIKPFCTKAIERLFFPLAIDLINDLNNVEEVDV
ncbi:hypothetical protein DFJ74DRAFT_32504 [Hyaloraphidium curvatum]|nr:hypothetical protein DFJ74DRAFT_32504 [Hyaloraphidium curvatum]